MAAVTTAPSERFVFGPLVGRSYDLTSVGDGDTMVVPLIRVLDVSVSPTTAISVGTTIVQSSTSATITFHGAFTGKVWIVGREG